MTRLFLHLVTFMNPVFLITAIEGFLATRLGESCFYDVQCQQKDSNSHCSSNDQRHRLMNTCICKVNYHVEIINNTERCIFGELPDEEKEGLTAAPIILCFMGCVVVEAFCLLAFRYWKKHRRTGLIHHTLHLEAIPLSDTRFPHHIQSRPLISFMIASQVDSTLAGSGASSPPPYSQTEMIGQPSSAQVEEPPPSYEEAMKQCIGRQSVSTTNLSQKKNKRKLSC